MSDTIPPIFVNPTANPSNPQTQLSEDFDTFLTLLTSQLQNQDPLEPLDSSEFTNQLVQFASVEQQIATRQGLEDLIQINTLSTAGTLAGYLGKDAMIDSDTGQLSNEALSWRYTLPQATASTHLSIQNAEGRTIYSEDGQIDQGMHSFNWNGQDFSGTQLPEGQYRLVVNALDANNQPLDVSVNLLTRIQGVDFSGNITQLTTPAGRFDFGAVLYLGERKN